MKFRIIASIVIILILILIALLFSGGGQAIDEDGNPIPVSQQ